MGSLDSRGVYIYDVDDNVAPMHTLLNLGQGSVSAAIDDAKQEAIDAMTPTNTGKVTTFLSTAKGWRNVGTTSQTFIRRKGDRVYIHLAYQRRGNTIAVPSTTGNITNITMATLHTKWRPQFVHPLSSSSTGRGAFYTVSANGAIRINAVSGSRNITNGERFTVTGVYYLNW